MAADGGDAAVEVHPLLVGGDIAAGDVGGHRPRASAARAGISDISQKERQIRFVVADFDAESIAALVTSAKYRRRLVVNAGDVPALTLTLQPKEPVLETALAFTEDLRLARESGEEEAAETEPPASP